MRTRDEVGRKRGREAAEGPGIGLPGADADVPPRADEGMAAFPSGPQWELTREHAWDWFTDGLAHLREGGAFLGRGGPLDGGALALLLLDLTCYHGLCERYLTGRGPRPPALEKYLEGWVTDAETGEVEECRQHWGYLGRAIRECWHGVDTVTMCAKNGEEKDECNP